MKNSYTLLVPVLLTSLVSQRAAQAPLPKMQLQMQSLDGNPSDIVGPSDVTSDDPFVERVWQIQGRRRGQVRISDRERQFDEEDKSFATRLQFAAIDLESDLPSEHRLFTLTERKVQQLEVGSTTFPAVIRVDNIQNPAAPVTIQDFTFGLEPSEDPGYICTIPGEKKLIVLMLPVLAEDPMDPPLVPAELRIYDYSSGLIPDPQLTPPSVAQIPTGDTGCIPPKKFRTLLSAQVESIQVPGAGDERMAIINATLVNATIVAGCAPKSPLPSGLLVCNVEDPFNPFFYATDLTKQAWDPCRSAGNPCLDWRIGGFAHVRTAGGDDLVYAVGGSQIDLTELDFSAVADHNVGIVENPITYSLDPDDLLCAVRADPAPSLGSDFLYVIGRKKAYVVDRENLGSPGFFQEAVAGFGHSGPAGDVQLMLANPEPPGMGPDQREIWTLAGQQASHVFRVTDFTQDGGALDAPDVSEKYYSAGPTDGAVANFAWDSVFTITFGGVVRWDISGSEPIPLADSYQPASSSVTGIDYTTEHLELVNFGTTGSPNWRLIAATAAGSFYAWPLDPITHDPLPGSVYEPPPLTFSPS